MSPYCGGGGRGGEGVAGEGAAAMVYELFSVVIHSGSTHSGHYTAYIRDVDCLGTWKHPVSVAPWCICMTLLLYVLGS